MSRTFRVVECRGCMWGFILCVIVCAALSKNSSYKHILYYTLRGVVCGSGVLVLVCLGVGVVFLLLYRQCWISYVSLDVRGFCVNIQYTNNNGQGSTTFFCLGERANEGQSNLTPD